MSDNEAYTDDVLDALKEALTLLQKKEPVPADLVAKAMLDSSKPLKIKDLQKLIKSRREEGRVERRQEIKEAIKNEEIEEMRTEYDHLVKSRNENVKDKTFEEYVKIKRQEIARREFGTLASEYGMSSGKYKGGGNDVKGKIAMLRQRNADIKEEERLHYTGADL